MKKISVRELMEQLKAAGTDQGAQRAVLRTCPVNFLQEMAEVVAMCSHLNFWRVPMTGKKKYYLDKLTHVYMENLPTEALKRNEATRLNWVNTCAGKREYLGEWKEYLA